MPLRLTSPFVVVSRISDAIVVDPDVISLRQLRDVVVGKTSFFSRTQAMALLLDSDLPIKHRDFEAVLENATERPEMRYAAAISLSQINTPAALNVLINNSNAQDDLVLAGIMSALGRIGDEVALEVIERVKETGHGRASEHAKFAAALLSYRLNLHGNNLLNPAHDDYLRLPDAVGRSLQIDSAAASDAELCLRCLGDRPFGIELVEHPMYHVRCGRNAWMVLFNRDFTRDDCTRVLNRRKTFPVVIASMNIATRLYSVAALMLTACAGPPDRHDVLICRPDGEMLFGGTMRTDGKQIGFSIRAVRRPGALPVTIEGVFLDNRLEIGTAMVGACAPMPKSRPTRECVRNRAGEATSDHK